MNDSQPHTTAFWRGFSLGVVALLVIGLAWQLAANPQPAYAQIPDSGAQRDRMIRELTEVNKQLKESVGLLKEIRDLSQDKKNEGRPTPPKP